MLTAHPSSGIQSGDDRRGRAFIRRALPRLLGLLCLGLLPFLGACAQTHPAAARAAAANYRVTEPEILTLPGGRRLAVHHFGDPHGRPLLFFHGWPSDGSVALVLDEAARRHHFRILAPDRPGIGRSDPLPHRTFADWPADVRAITAHYGIGKFAVMGVSGGGPYALATARAMPERIRGAAVVCGAVPLDDPRDAATLLPDYKKLLHFQNSHPALLRIGFRMGRPMMHLVPDSWLLRGTRKYPAPDRAVVANARYFAICFTSMRRSWDACFDGVHDDAVLYACPWSFAPSQIRTHVDFWHGALDANFPPALARKLAASVPGASIRVVPGEGHYSLPVNRADAIFAALARPAR
jgi:pimeloyl-ACP methyl ester carboxylesterase